MISHFIQIYIEAIKVYFVLAHMCHFDDLWPLLLTWFNFNPSMDM